jgi:hypothetical protein
MIPLAPLVANFSLSVSASASGSLLPPPFDLALEAPPAVVGLSNNAAENSL